jgi:hypothetical protein
MDTTAAGCCCWWLLLLLLLLPLPPLLLLSDTACAMHHTRARCRHAWHHGVIPATEHHHRAVQQPVREHFCAIYI